MPHFNGCRQFRVRPRSCPGADREQLELFISRQLENRRQGQHRDMDPVRHQIGNGTQRIAVRHEPHTDIGAFLQRPKGQIRCARQARIGKLIGLAPRELHQIVQRLDGKRRRDDNALKIINDVRYRQQVARRVIWEVCMHRRIDRHDARECEQQRVAIVGAQQRPNRQDAVSTGPVFHRDGLTPTLAQSFGQRARDRIGTAAGARSRDQADGSPRPPGSGRGGYPCCKGHRHHSQPQPPPNRVATPRNAKEHGYLLTACIASFWGSTATIARSRIGFIAFENAHQKFHEGCTLRL